METVLSSETRNSFAWQSKQCSDHIAVPQNSSVVLRSRKTTGKETLWTSMSLSALIDSNLRVPHIACFRVSDPQSFDAEGSDRFRSNSVADTDTDTDPDRVRVNRSHLDRSIHVSVFGSEDGIESARRETVFDLRLCTLQHKFYLHDPLPHSTHLYIPGTCSTGTSWCGSGKRKKSFSFRISSLFRVQQFSQALCHHTKQ